MSQAYGSPHRLCDNRAVLRDFREKMYKTQFTRWGFRKNYKAADKERLARIVKACRKEGQNLPSLTFRNRPVKFDRIRRHLKQKNILLDACDNLRAATTSRGYLESKVVESVSDVSKAQEKVIARATHGTDWYAATHMSDSRGLLFDPERPFSTESGRIELVLLQARNYFEWRLTVEAQSRDAKLSRNIDTVSRPAATPTVDCTDFFDHFAFGVDLLEQRQYARGWQLIHQSCSLAHALLDQQPRSLLRHLFRVFGDKKWTDFQKLRIHLLRYLAKCAVQRFGCKHPVSITLYHLQEEEVFLRASDKAYKVMIDVSDQHQDRGASLVLKQDLCDMLIKRKDHAAARSHIVHFLRQAEDTQGRNSHHARWLLRQLGRVCSGQGRDDLAESYFLDALRRGREALGTDIPDDTSVYTYENLASIYERRGDFVKSERQWRAALSGAIRLFGADHELTVYGIGCVEASFRKQGQDPKLWLLENFGISTAEGEAQ